MLKYDKLIEGLECVVKIRSLDKGTNAKIYNNINNTIRIDFLSEVKGGIAFGQSAVIYEGDDVVCGGFILANK